MTHFFLRIVTFSLLFILGSHQKSSAFTSSNKYAAVVIDSSTGRVLHEKNAHKRRHPASLVKKMSLYLIFKALKEGKITLSTQFKVSSFAAKQIPCKLGLRPRDTIKVEAIIKGMVTKSANDASVVIAEGMTGSLSNFVDLMNKQAKELGMHSTQFFNASGVPDPRQITTAMDMAILAQALYRDFPEYCHYFQTKQFSYLGASHHNHNHMLGKFPGLDGIKTGFTCASGFNISTSAIRYDTNKKPRRLFAVVMGGESWRSRDKHTAQLLEEGFKKIGAVSREIPKSLPVLGSKGLPSQREKAQEDAALLEASLQETEPMSEGMQTVSYAPPAQMNYPAPNYTQQPPEQTVCQTQCPMPTADTQPAPQITTMTTPITPSQQMTEYLESVKSCPVPEKPLVQKTVSSTKKGKGPLQPIPSLQKKATPEPTQLVSGKKALPAQWVVPKPAVYKESSLSPVKKISFSKKKMKKKHVKKARSHRRRSV